MSSAPSGTSPARVRQFHLDLRHPLTGPLTAYIPVIAMLLVPPYASGLDAVGRGLIYLTLGRLMLNAAALVAHWLKAPLVNDAFHPGYFLPVAAGPFIASIGLASLNDIAGAVALFGVDGHRGARDGASEPRSIVRDSARS